jgi:MFS family permease
VPQNGKIMFTLYYVLYGIAMGGVNSALINMIFDYVPHEKRADSLAVSQAFSGVTGFLTTLTVSPIVDLVQNNGNKIFSIQIYAQQAVTALGVIFSVLAIFYVRFFLINKKSEVK